MPTVVDIFMNQAKGERASVAVEPAERCTQCAKALDLDSIGSFS